MTWQAQGGSTGGSPAENYQRFFVPAIGAPMADDLMGVADLQAGERVLDVACGTGVVTRLAARDVGAAGVVAGLDVNPGMLAVARSQTPQDLPVEWHEASAEAMPFADGTFDVALCQMGLQFVPNKLAALREMRRVLDTDGRVAITVPGPRPPLFADMSEALARHLNPDAASFVDHVFSMHDCDELAELLRAAGFRGIAVNAATKSVLLPAPADFLWQYLSSTPLADAVAQAGDDTRAAITFDVCAQWQTHVVDDSLPLQVGMITAIAVK